MPALQGIYVAITQLRFISPALDTLYNDLKNLKPYTADNKAALITLNKNIVLKNIYFDYPNASRTALKNIYLNIDANTTVGLVGTTGSGKTTTVDIILGILEAQRGTLEVDGKVIDETRFIKNLENKIRLGVIDENIVASELKAVLNEIRAGAKVKNLDSDKFSFIV